MDPKHIPTEIPHVQPKSKKRELLEYWLDFPDLSFQQILDKVKNHGLEHLTYEQFFLVGKKNKLYLPPKNMSVVNFLVSTFLSKSKVDERYNQEFCNLFNIFHNQEIGVKRLEAALKRLGEEYYLLEEFDFSQEDCYRTSPSQALFNMFHNQEIGAEELGAVLMRLGEEYYLLEEFDFSQEDCCRLIHRTSLSQPLPPGGPSTSGCAPGTNAWREGVPVGIGDPSSSVKHSPPGKGKGKVPHEEGASGVADVSGDAIGSMNAPPEGDLEMGLVNNNAAPPAPGDVPSSVVHHVDNTAAGSGVYGENVAMTNFQVAAAACRTATSKFAQASHTTSLATSMAAILLADTKWKAAAPILAKAGIISCGVGVLADIGKDLPLRLFMGP